MIKSWFAGVVLAGVAAVMVPVADAEAKRLGGSKSTGMQRQTPTQPVQKAPDASPAATPGAAGAAAPATAAAAAAATKAGAPAAAQAARRSWTGPLMGLAAGLGLAALFNAMGMGETFSSIMMMLLLAMVAVFAFRFIMSRFGGARGRKVTTDGLAAAGAGAAGANAPVGFTAAQDSGSTQRSTLAPTGTQGIRIGSALAPAAGANALDTIDDAADRRLPVDFDRNAFERVAKTIFVRLQAANDERNLDDLRAFSTPEMFAELRTDLLERADASQRTEVVSVNPTIVDFADEGHQRVVSVRYVGVIREDEARGAEPFDETWHLVQTGDSPAWRIGGIQVNNNS